MKYTREEVDEAMREAIASGLEGDVQILVAHIEELRAIVDAIDELRTEEGACVTILCDNQDFDGPNSAIEVYGGWRVHEPREIQRFEGDNLADGLQQAVAAKRAAEGKQA